MANIIKVKDKVIIKVRKIVELRLVRRNSRQRLRGFAMRLVVLSYPAGYFLNRPEPDTLIIPA